MMVSNVLDYSKMQEGMLEIVFQEENINDLVRDTVDLHLQKIQQKGIVIKVY